MKFEIYDAGGTCHWRLLAFDAQVLATSMGRYANREAVCRAIGALQTSIPVARIVNGVFADSAAPYRRARPQIQTLRRDEHVRTSIPRRSASVPQSDGCTSDAIAMIALIQQCMRELTEEDVHAVLIVRLRTLTAALALMPLET